MLLIFLLSILLLVSPSYARSLILTTLPPDSAAPVQDIDQVGSGDLLLQKRVNGKFCGSNSDPFPPFGRDAGKQAAYDFCTVLANEYIVFQSPGFIARSFHYANYIFDVSANCKLSSCIGYSFVQNKQACVDSINEIIDDCQSNSTSSWGGRYEFPYSIEYTIRRQTPAGEEWQLPPYWSQDIHCYTEGSPDQLLNVNSISKELVHYFCYGEPKPRNVASGQTMSSNEGDFQKVFKPYRMIVYALPNSLEPSELCANGIPLSKSKPHNWIYVDWFPALCFKALTYILDTCDDYSLYNGKTFGGHLWYACGNWTIKYEA